MHRQTKTELVIYHSLQWEIMASSGWITHTVDDNGIATMFKFC